MKSDGLYCFSPRLSFFFQFSVSDEKKAFLKIVSSSHGLNNEKRHLQRELRRVMKVNNTFFTEANFDAVGGREIDKNLVEKIIIDMKKVNFLNKTLVLIIGSNNIRKKGKAIDIMEYFELLLKFVNFWKNFRVVVCGIIPSIPDARSKKNFCEASKLLKKMCLKYNVASFCPLANYLTNKGIVNPELYQEDGIHLNELGSRFVSFAINNHLQKYVLTMFKK